VTPPPTLLLSIILIATSNLDLRIKAPFTFPKLPSPSVLPTVNPRFSSSASSDNTAPRFGGGSPRRTPGGAGAPRRSDNQTFYLNIRVTLTKSQKKIQNHNNLIVSSPEQHTA
jgi:hypothetical protein